jgi:hypothetical protein
MQFTQVCIRPYFYRDKLSQIQWEYCIYIEQVFYQWDNTIKVSGNITI